jgi:hypothetical protein
MSFLAPLFFAGLAAIAVPILVHLIQRERKDVIRFPSLMFLRRIPYQSVERRRIHNWLLLALRAAAMALLIAAFSRPFFTEDQVKAAALMTGAREVVILLDRSASMGYADHWERAREEARKVVRGLSGEDKATLLLFGRGTEENVRATSDKARLEAAINEATVSSDATRYGPALRWAQGLLSRSALPRKEAVLISDFQKSGWERQEDIHLPEGATLAPISVADPETADLSISSVAIARTSFASEERVALTVGLTNRSSAAMNNVPVKLELDGREIGARTASVGPNASASVTFPPFTAAEANMRAVIHAGTDKWTKNNVYYLAISPSRPVSVLAIQREGGITAPCGPDCAGYYLATALGLSKSPPFKMDVLSASRVTAASLAGRSVVVLYDAAALSTDLDAMISRFVQQGGGLFIVLGDHSPWGSGESPLLPGKLGASIDRPIGHDGTLGFLDYSHPVFEQFKDPRQGNFSNVRFFRYRALQPAPTDRVLAKFDDGAVAMVERRVGSGRVIAFTSTLDEEAGWNDFHKRAMFPPLAVLVTQYLAQYEEPTAWYTVGRMLDVSVPLGSLVRAGTAADTGSVRKPSGIVSTPGGQQLTIGEGGAPSIELSEQGFYSVRMQGIGDRRPFQVAVNLDPAESDLSALPPAEFVKSATGRAAVTASGQSLEHPDLTPEDIEKKQSLWWFLLFAGVLALVTEAALSNRLSKRFGEGFLQMPGKH